MKILITGGNGNIAKIIKNNLKNYNENNTQHIFNAPGRDKLNLLDAHMVKDFMENNDFDICFHTCILGGRRTKAEDYDVFYINLLMFENLMKYSYKFKMIFNMDSGAIYDRNTDILNRKEDEMNTIPEDFYGFSKYVIYQRSLNHKNLYNLRIFNIFHPNEEENRFIKLCFSNAKNDTIMNIQDDKYFDFVYYLDFIKIIEYYVNNIDNQEILPKTINISYDKKYKLSEIAKLISPHIKLNITNENSKNNYSGNPEKINSFKLNFIGLENSITHYRETLL
jgi:nucleoside-diphosphate-sugar epimerase